MLCFLRGDNNSPNVDLAEYQQIIQEAKSQIQKLTNSDRQQQTFIANLKKKQEELMEQVNSLTIQLSKINARSKKPDAEKFSQTNNNQYRHQQPAASNQREQQKPRAESKQTDLNMSQHSQVSSNHSKLFSNQRQFDELKVEAEVKHQEHPWAPKTELKPAEPWTPKQWGGKPTAPAQEKPKKERTYAVASSEKSHTSSRIKFGQEEQSALEEFMKSTVN